MGGRIWVKGVDAHNLVIRSGGEIFAIGREANSMNGAGVVAHRSQLSRFGVVGVAGIVDGIRRPNSNMAICGEAVRV